MVRTAVLINLPNSTTAGAPRLAGLPLLLRAVLTAQRAGLEEVIIGGGPDPAPLLRRHPRVTIKWRWVPLDSSQASGENHGARSSDELSVLRHLRHEVKEDFVLLFADSTFDAAALQSLRSASLDGKAARVVKPQGDAAGADSALYLCRPEFLQLLDDHHSPNGATDGVGSFASALRARERLSEVEIDGQVWGRVTDADRLREIGRALSHFHLKPSDGVFAKFNKLVVAEPLIRFFLHTPATPNFITTLGLLLGVAAGVAFAQGSYWWSLFGALLSYSSAIMDHCDGMVARLKFQETKFGTWFESAVDYASYLAIFSGLAVGLYRETGVAHHLIVGALFLFGTLLSFIVQSHQRRLVSKDNPADYANRVCKKLEENSGNFFHWLSLHAVFLTRRAVLPYFVFLFCLLDLRVLLLGWVTLGANIFWLMLLYQHRLLRPPKAAAEAD